MCQSGYYTLKACLPDAFTTDMHHFACVEMSFKRAVSAADTPESDNTINMS